MVTLMFVPVLITMGGGGVAPVLLWRGGLVGGAAAPLGLPFGCEEPPLRKQVERKRKSISEIICWLHIFP